MFKKILLPVDLSDKHYQALEVAAGLASQSGAEVVLLHVIELLGGLDEEKEFYNRLEKKTRHHLDRLGGFLKQRHISWQGKILFGSRGPEVIRYARETVADLIILTSPRLDPNHLESGLGSLSYKISIFSACPVLLVK